MSEPWTDIGVVETYTGGKFDLFDPDPDDVRLLDIAAGLAHTCRFGGHCREFYSVAHHSIHVSRELPSDDPRLQLLGLFHDTGEAYVGDIPRPLKAKFDMIERIEDRIRDTIWTSFDIDPPTDDEWEAVMAADDRLLAYEATHLLEDGTWAERSPDLGYDLQSGATEAIREQFRSRSETLLNRL
jgi:hypothetical protein